MKKWNLIIDIAKCHNSNNCFLSVADEYIGNDHEGYSASMPLHGHHWFNIHRKERGQAPMVDLNYLATTCNHCDDAPCIKAAKNEAVIKREDGIVIIDPEKSKGQKQIVDACPYDSVWWNEEKNIPQAWTFDAHLLDSGWSEPRCASACPTGAIKAVKIEDSEMTQKVIDEELQVLQPKLKTKPRVYYKNLDLITKCFIGGTTVTNDNGVEECAVNASVLLYKNGKKISETNSDDFGDFKFDGLEPDSGNYELEILYQNSDVQKKSVNLKDSEYLGLINV